MGSQWIGMARDLMQLPIFARSVYKCHEILKPRGVDLLKIITDTSDPEMFENILHSFVGIAAVQVCSFMCDKIQDKHLLTFMTDWLN